MEDGSPNPREPDFSNTVFEFTPGPMARNRANGWTPLTQRRFIHALSVMGSVGAAAKAVGMGRVLAYRLLEREGAESFAAAWANAMHHGRWRQYGVAMTQAINGVTTIHVQRGGSITVRGGPDMNLVRAALRDEPAPNRQL
jgi:hypothetical protein